jgi:opacity protein-like surface antigen
VQARITAVLFAVGVMLFAITAAADDPAVKAIVFVPPRDIESPLRDALTAQLSGVAVELVVEHFVSEPDSLKQNVEESRSLAAAHQALGVFWLDARATDEWFVYLAVPAGRRVLMRRVPIGVDGSVAAMEAVAVITRESTAALLAGQTIGMSEVVIPDEPEKPVTIVIAAPPKPAPVPTPRVWAPLHGFSFSTSYYADVYAKDSGLSSGLSVAAAWRFTSGVRLGVSFVTFQPEEASVEGLAFLVRRYPIGVEAGYAYARRNWVLGLALRSVLELTTRHVLAALPPAAPTEDSQRAVVFLSPRLRFDYRVSEATSLFLAAGADFALNGFSFVNRVDGVDRPVFEPLRVRPAGEVGVAFWP